MHPKVESAIERWVSAGLIDPSTAEQLRVCERGVDQPQKFQWPVLLAVSFGGALLCAGVLLFVAAHWEELSPAQRFSLVLFLVAIFHIAGAFLSERFHVLSTILHAVGTVSLGAGIFMAGQIFNLEEHWPGGVLLWAMGAWAGWAIRRDLVHATLAALLTPSWLAGEWIVATERYVAANRILSEGLLLLSITYLTARFLKKDSLERQALSWLGGLSLIPCVLFVLLSFSEHYYLGGYPAASAGIRYLGWVLAFSLPLIAAYTLRQRLSWMNLLAAVWVLILGTTVGDRDDTAGLAVYIWHQLGSYIWCGIGSVALILWGLKESRKERINLGIAGFGLTVMGFYFSTVMDKLGRSLSLIGFGGLFLLCGWWLERMRRQLMSRLQESRS